MIQAPQLSLLVLGGALSALAVSIWRARPHSPVNRRFGIQTFFLALWVFGVSGLQGDRHLEFWGRITFASAIMIPPTFLLFTRAFPTESAWPSTRLMQGVVGVGVLLALLSLATPLLLIDVSLGPRGLERRTGPLYPAYPVYFLSTWAIGVALFIAQWRQARGLAKAQLQYVGTGISIAAVGGITFNLLLPWLAKSSIYNSVGPYFTLAFAALVAHAIIRHRLMDLRPIIHRGLAYTLVTVAISVAVIGLTRLVITDPVESARLDILLVCASALAMLTMPAQRFLKRAVDPYFYRGRLDHESALRDGMHRLAHLMEPIEFAGRLRSIFAETLVPDSFTLLVPTPENIFECLGSELNPDHLEVAQKHVTAFLAKESPHFVVLLASESDENSDVLSLLSLGVELLVILRRRGDVLGVVLLGPRRSGDPYYAKDLRFIESLAELAAIALENTLLYRQRIHILEYSERLLESLDSAVIATNTSGRITSHNPAAARLFGTVPMPPREMNIGVLPPDIGWALGLAVRGLHLARELEVRVDHPTRGPVPVILSTAVLHGDDRAIVGALAVVTDLSTVKALEQNQRRLEHLSLMARFYAGIAHEIRNPLAAISNFVSMLPDRFDDPEYRDTASRLLPLEVERITALADRLRLMAPGAGGTLAPVDVKPLMADIVAIHAPVAQESNVSLVVRCPDEVPTIAADPNQLIQLFLNLLRNAIEAMPSGGTVVFEATATPGLNYEGSLVIRVIDEGHGIAPAVRSNIFEPFFTTKPKGSGLGLAICREIVAFHGARLSLNPRDDRPGTVAEVQFPDIREHIHRDVDDSSLGAVRAVRT